VKLPSAIRPWRRRVRPSPNERCCTTRESAPRHPSCTRRDRPDYHQRRARGCDKWIRNIPTRHSKPANVNGTRAFAHACGNNIVRPLPLTRQRSGSPSCGLGQRSRLSGSIMVSRTGRRRGRGRTYPATIYRCQDSGTTAGPAGAISAIFYCVRAVRAGRRPLGSSRSCAVKLHQSPAIHHHLRTQKTDMEINVRWSYRTRWSSR
jgi:hypothetical protein